MKPTAVALSLAAVGLLALLTLLGTHGPAPASAQITTIRISIMASTATPR